MIPTTASNASPAAPANIAGSPNSSSVNSTNNTNNNNNSNSNNNNGQNCQQNYSTVILGIASLILEGRPIADDEYQQPQTHSSNARQTIADASNHQQQSHLHNLQYNQLQHHYNQLHNQHTNVDTSGLGSIGGGSGAFGGGRQSPKPSTSRASPLTSVATANIINITTNPYVLSGAVMPTAATTSPYTSSTSTTMYNDPFYYVSHGNGGSGSSSSFNESTHQRWTQKLCQLRQVSPAAQSITAEPELVSLSINNDLNSDRGGGDFEIVRRVMLNRANINNATIQLSSNNAASSAASSPSSGSENILHSLQSLATTCLRGGSPSIETTNSRNLSPLSHSHSPLPASSSSSSSSSFHYYTPQLTAGTATAISTTMATHRSLLSPRFQNPYLFCDKAMSSSSCSGSSSGNGNGNGSASSTAAAIKTTASSSSPSLTNARPQHGPHCDQFLKKMGLVKGETADIEDHFCDMSYVNITCSRWRAYCLKIAAIVSRGEPVCIEVYLGPVGHKILLEQWIISAKERLRPPTMTLPSLCSAIRSQLYFSQIVAWCDLLRKTDKSIYDSGRVIFAYTTGVAGDLATPTSCSSANATPSSSPINQTIATAARAPRPRLNIFYRIKQYDTTATFNTKPNVHNFPNVNVSEKYSISVCVKSLPRINGGIPKVIVPTITPTPTSASTSFLPSLFDLSPNTQTACCVASTPTNGGNFSAAATPTGLAAKITNETPRTSRSSNKATKPPEDGHILGNTITPLSSSSNSSSSNCDKNSTKWTPSAADCPSAGSSKLTSMPHSITADDKQTDKYKCYHDTVKELNALDEKTELDELKTYLEETDGGGGFGDDDDVNSTNLSHREKQLQKYRKRMLKRDKKRERKPFNDGDDDDDGDKSQCAGNHQQRSTNKSNQTSIQPMDECVSPPTQVHRTTTTMISTGTQTPMTCCQQCGSEKTLVCLHCSGASSGDGTTNGKCSAGEDSVAEMDELDGSVSSISSCDIISTPRNNAELLLQAIQRTPKNKKKKMAASAPSQPTNDLSRSMRQQQALLQNNNHVGDGGHKPATTTTNLGAGCQVCKRQKTQHVFSNGAGGGDSGGEEAASIAGNNLTAIDENTPTTAAAAGADNEDDVENGDGKILNVTEQAQEARNNTSAQLQVMEDEEIFYTSTKLTPHIDHCTLDNCQKQNTAASVTQQVDRRCYTPPNTTNQTTASDLLASDASSVVVTEFKTPNSSIQQQQQQHDKEQQNYKHKQTPKPNLLHISCTYRDMSTNGLGTSTYSGDDSVNWRVTPPTHQSQLLLRKALPKVNLTPIFCNPVATATTTLKGALSAPIPIKNGCCGNAMNGEMTFSFEPNAINLNAGQSHFQSQSNVVAAVVVDTTSSVPVQKSYSAPTLPNSLSLSPRFAKQAAFYKRRSRHLSDRSDRSSLGSDEQLSDEDFEANGIYSPAATSPLKCRTRMVAQFGRRPLLGNLEECLLQKRLMPKVEVMGFKVLLGASGGFCPTQLTIPAAAYFYELHGETLSTPYLCEIRLPRKGYFVPRTGTVQATLLNPMGTVVRMFVIPYDMRDMPPLHRTFIRQRILADESPKSIDNSMDIGGQQSSGDVDAISKGDADKNANMNGYLNSNKNKYSPTNSNGSLHSESKLGHFITAEQMKRLRYSIHLRFQTSRSGRLSLHTDIRFLISRRTDCDTAAAHAKGVLEAPNELVTDTVMPTEPRYSARQENPSKI